MVMKNNASKIEGVRKKNSKWVAEIKHPKKKNVRIWLGTYVTPQEASKVYQAKKMAFAKKEAGGRFLDDQESAANVVGDDQLKKINQDVITKIEGVRKKRSKWVAEIKDPRKKNVRIWLGTYTTPEEASKVYQAKKMEFEAIKLEGVAEKEKRFLDDQESIINVDVAMDEAVDEDDDDQYMDCCSRTMKIIEQDDDIFIDRYGYILGDFSWIDDLSIIDD